ncbi:hypothetical protein SLEP1_g31308 [Rubroshorea leprosula]|uniref:Uncharacterized protein n=1 Tax=Rubroshorea leprosula TaxID=152421 RepID=A0AAV5KAB8_9ROSI|nr:hypothetical protein SLEP1_g31308 [Rubroshorea leprosula]
MQRKQATHLWRIEQNLQQQFGQTVGSSTNQGSPASAGTIQRPQERFVQPADTIESSLPDRLINQAESSQAAPVTEQYLGQSLSKSPHSQRNIGGISKEEPWRAGKRVHSRLYRQRVKGRDKLIKEKSQLKKSSKKIFEAEKWRLKREIDEKEQLMNSIMEATEKGRLKREINEKELLMKSNLEPFEGENGGLKHEIQAKSQLMKSNMETLEAEMKRLNDEFESLKRNNVSVNRKVQVQLTELAELRNKLDELKQQNQRTKKKRRISSTREWKAAQIQLEKGGELVRPAMPCMMENFDVEQDEGSKVVLCGVGDVFTWLPTMKVFLFFFFFVLVMSCSGV